MLLCKRNGVISIGNRCEDCNTAVAGKKTLVKKITGTGFKLNCRKCATNRTVEVFK